MRSVDYTTSMITDYDPCGVVLLGSRGWDSGFRAFPLRISCVGFGMWGLRLEVEGLHEPFSYAECRGCARRVGGQYLGFAVWGLVLRIWGRGSMFWDEGLGLWISSWR